MTTLSELPFVTTEDVADRAMEAIRGGRVITDHLAYYIGEDAFGGFRRALSGELGPKAVAHAWKNQLDPAIGWGWLSRPEADETKMLTLSKAEAMLDWPIYRAAVARQEAEPAFVEGYMRAQNDRDAHPQRLSIEDRQDLVQAIEYAGEALAMKREINNDYEPEDLAQMDEALERWSNLSARIGSSNGGTL